MTEEALEESHTIREAIKAYVKDVINPTNTRALEDYLDREYPLVKYPALFQFLEENPNGDLLAVMFTSETSGYAVTDTGDWNVGDEHNNWISHYDALYWEPAKIVPK